MSILSENLLGEDPIRLPIDGLPYTVQDVIQQYAKAFNCPLEFVIGAAMAAAAQAAGNRFYWTNDIYTCYPQFYTALVGESTANKTGTIKKMFKPLELADREAFHQWELATSGKDKKDKAKVPYQIGLLQDYTLEAYQDALRFNPNGVTALCDEILSFFGNLNRYRDRGDDEKFFLTTFGSYSDYKRTRRGDGVDLIKAPIVRIIGGIQPDVLQRTFGGSAMITDGMLPRFLWYAVPEDFRFDESGETFSTKDVESSWETIINRLLNHKETIQIEFDSEAQELYKNYKIEHSKGKNNQTIYGYRAAVCGKLEIYAIIWAMTTRVLRYASDETGEAWSLEILGADMKYSLRCMEYFEKTAMKVYDTITDTTNKLKRADCIRGLADDIKNQSQFADSLGLSHQYVNKIINGK